MKSSLVGWLDDKKKTTKYAHKANLTNHWTADQWINQLTNTPCMQQPDISVRDGYEINQGPTDILINQ